MFKFEVRQGDKGEDGKPCLGQHINSIQVINVTDDLIYFTIDCKEKYPEITGSMIFGNYHAFSVDIGLQEGREFGGRLRNVELFNDASVTIELDKPKDYTMITDVGRYSVNVIMVGNKKGRRNYPYWDDYNGNMICNAKGQLKELKKG